MKAAEALPNRVRGGRPRLPPPGPAAFFQSAAWGAPEDPFCWSIRSDCGTYRRDGRFWFKHEQIEPDCSDDYCHDQGSPGSNGGFWNKNDLQDLFVLVTVLLCLTRATGLSCKYRRRWNRSIRRIVIPVSVGYGCDPRKVRATLRGDYLPPRLQEVIISKHRGSTW